jgi:hypothetical protein
MATIYKTYLPPITWGEVFISEDNIEIINELKIEETKLTNTWTKKISGESPSEVILYSVELNLETLKASPRFGDQTFFTISNNEFVLPKIGSSQEEIHTVIEDQIISIFDRSSTNKTKTLFGPPHDIKEWSYPLRIFVPNASGNFTNFVYQLVGVKDLDVTNTNITNTFKVNTPYTIETNSKKSSEFIANITSTTTGNPAVGDTIPVTVTCENTSVASVFLEPVVGIIDRTEVKLTSGVGKFNILTSTLEAGDIVKVKIGHKKWSNVTTFTKTLGA